MLTPDNILGVSFTKAGKSAYKADEVDEYVSYTQNIIKQLKSEKTDLESKIIVLAEKIEEYRKDEDSLRAALLGAQRFGDNIVKEAKSKAEIILRDANIKAEYALNDITKQIETQNLELTRLKAEVTNFKSKMLSIYKTHIEFINALPSYSENETHDENRGESSAEGETISENANNEAKI